MSSTEQFSLILLEWIKVFMRRSGQDFKRFMDESGMSFSQVNVLMRLHFGGKADVSEIGALLGISNAAASQLVDRLVQMQLLERMEDKQDRRVKWLSLTPKGEHLIDKLVAARRQWLEKFIETLPAQQRQNIGSALECLTEAARNFEE